MSEIIRTITRKRKTLQWLGIYFNTNNSARKLELSAEQKTSENQEVCCVSLSHMKVEDEKRKKKLIKKYNSRDKKVKGKKSVRFPHFICNGFSCYRSLSVHLGQFIKVVTVFVFVFVDAVKVGVWIAWLVWARRIEAICWKCYDSRKKFVEKAMCWDEL